MRFFARDRTNGYPLRITHMDYETMMQTLLEKPEAKEVVDDNRDLSGEISSSVERRPGDRVKCRRVGRDTYRCNWFALDAEGTSRSARFIESYRIRDSRFLRARRVNGRLMIEDLTLTAARNN